MDNKTKPLIYTDEMKDHLERVLSGFTYIRARKWGAKRTFYRFCITGDAFKIILSPTRNVDKAQCVYYDDKYAACWVINAYYHHLSAEKVLKIVKATGKLIVDYETQEFLETLATIAKNKNINPKSLEYKQYTKNDYMYCHFSEEDNEKYYEMGEELTKEAIKELCIKMDKYGITYHVIRKMVHTLFGCLIDGEANKLSMNWVYRKI